MGFVCWVLIVSLLVCWHSLLVVLKTRMLKLTLNLVIFSPSPKYLHEYI
uniref:Uncharacterized protein n=1 Tax=Physcomitrium patens TaxID=3218 RepID=A0A2K1KKM4_PHYPA|nr:hypothetical protein PHYPA_007996 [Physcomitrium patens]